MGLFNKSKETITIQVDGIKCEHCVKRIKDTLKNSKVTCEISLQEKTVKVTFDSNKITLNDIKNIIDDLGFKCN